MWTVVLIILALFLPPLAAFLVVGLGIHFWINLILTLLLWLPGTVHALWLIVRRSSGPRRERAGIVSRSWTN